MFTFKDVTFRYTSISPCILRDFNCEIAPGEIVGMTGASGKGKTTLAKIMAGYLRPQKGGVFVDEMPLARKGYCPVQLVFQHPEKAINPRWTMKKVLSETEGLFPDRELLEELSVSPQWFGRYAHELSGGELQRIAVARILNPATRFIVADEMTSMLDPLTQAQIWNTVISFSKTNIIGIIAISHDRDLLNRICDRQITLDSSSTVRQTCRSNDSGGGHTDRLDITSSTWDAVARI